MTAEQPNTIAELSVKRVEIAGQIAQARATLRQLFADLDRVDAAIRDFDENDGTEGSDPKTAGGHITYRGELERIVLNLLREAPDPLTTKAVALHIMGKRGKKISNDAMVKMMTHRAGVLLSRYQDRGSVRAIRDHKHKKPDLWEIAV